jgi:hypothetical protein
LVFFFSVVGVPCWKEFYHFTTFLFSRFLVLRSHEEERDDIYLCMLFFIPCFSRYYTTHIRNGFYNFESLLSIEVPKMCVCVGVGVGVGVCVCVCQLTEFENDGSFEMFLLVESNVFILLKLVSQFASFYTYEM